MQKSLCFNSELTKNDRCHSCAVALAITVLLSYVILGAAAFFILENRAHEQRVRRWYLNLALERRQFARTINLRIFNDTKQLPRMIGRSEVEKVQAHLVAALKEYEEHLNLQLPDRTDWNMKKSINYVLALLTTIGNANRFPETVSGQNANVGFKRRIINFQIFLVIYVAWISLIAVYLAAFVPDVNFRMSIYIAVFSALTIQIPYHHDLESVPTLVLLVMVLIALLVKMILVFLWVSLYDFRRKASNTSKVNDGNPGIPKFRAIIQSSGRTKLVN